MFQEVSFHPEERRRVKGILKTIGSDYWCVMDSSQRVRAGREDCKAGASTKNFEAPWAYAVVTFLHKDVFKQPTHLDWAAQYSNKAMRHMLRGRMSCLWAPRHSESPMLVINIHQAGSATLEPQQRMWIAQGIQLTCMHDLGITTSRNLSLQDQELLLDAPEWRAMLQADIQRSKNQLDSMAKKQTRRCEHQAKRQEAREYLRDKKGPSKFCGNTHSLQMPKELVLGIPVGIMWINQDRQRLRKRWKRRYAKQSRQ